ncbi:MAG TPA: cytochrome c biogenesis protein CcsA [Anaeromyxobacteraceae bacterium]|nr:cytochrome c biogenesis protein CcsA [Anaeromyxobacteraceae bacterium]
MSIQVLRIAALFYAVAAILYVLYFARPRHAALATAGKWILGAAFVVHGASIGLGCKEYGGMEFFSLRGGIVTIAWLAAGFYLFLQRLYRIPTVGAFVVPLVLVVIAPTLLLSSPNLPASVPEGLRRPVLTLHIVTALGGVAVFCLAFVVAVMYLLQEREVKGKRFGALFSRLPSLDSLDQLNQRLVRAGFVVFTVALVLGAFMAHAVWKSAWEWDPQQVSSLVIWGLYGTMVQLRHTGWHGRRYAALTIVGFLLVIGSMVTLNVIPGATRHGGTYQ